MCYTKAMTTTHTTVYIWRDDKGTIHGVFADKESAVAAIIDPATEFVTAHKVRG